MYSWIAQKRSLGFLVKQTFPDRQISRCAPIGGTLGEIVQFASTSQLTLFP